MVLLYVAEKGTTMHIVRAGDAVTVVNNLPSKSDSEVHYTDFNPESICAVVAVRTDLGPALSLMSDDSGVRILIGPTHAKAALNSLKTSGSYRKATTQDRTKWAITRAKAANTAA